MTAPMTDALLELPSLTRELFIVPTQSALQRRAPSTHAPRILLLYGSLSERSFSRLLSEEAARGWRVRGVAVPIGWAQ